MLLLVVGLCLSRAVGSLFYGRARSPHRLKLWARAISVVYLFSGVCVLPRITSLPN